MDNFCRVERKFWQCANHEAGISIESQFDRDGNVTYNGEIPWARIFADIDNPRDYLHVSPEEALELGEILLAYGRGELTGHTNIHTHGDEVIDD